MRPEIPIQDVPAAPTKLALSRLLLRSQRLVSTDNVESFLPAESRQDERETRWFGLFMSWWTFAAIGLWWLHGVSEMAIWETVLRVLLWPLIWFLSVQGMVMLCLVTLAMPLLKSGLMSVEKIKAVMQAACWLALTMMAIWLIRQTSVGTIAIGAIWMLFIGAELLARLVRPSALQ